MLVGKKAPHFSAMACQEDEIFELSSSRVAGFWTLLFFYPKDFTKVCPTELRALALRAGEFEAEGARILAISTDDVRTHQRWLREELPEVKFPLLADSTHRISSDYGVLVEGEDVAQRAAFIIDPLGVVRYVVVSDMDVGRSVAELLRVLQALKTGALCPADWKKGDKPLPSKLA
ncbi:Peroxiredoxin [uncultured archaeon]|nr:Peroxiredoxin [uncultured archaeon]